MGLLKEHVYRNLSEHGNSFIMPSDFERLGVEAIIKDLQAHGFVCSIEQRKCITNFYGYPTTKGSKKKEKDIIYLIQEVRRFKDEH